MLHQWFTCVHLLDTYLANLKEGFQLSFHYPSVSIRAAQSGLQSVPAYRMRWGCHHLFRSYDGNPSNIANIRLHSVSGHTFCPQSYCKKRDNSKNGIISSKILNTKQLSTTLSRYFKEKAMIFPKIFGDFKISFYLCILVIKKSRG